jgi:hypothetical protein
MDCEIPILEKSTTPMLMYEELPDFMIFTCLYCKNKSFFTWNALIYPIFEANNKLQSFLHFSKMDLDYLRPIQLHSQFRQMYTQWLQALQALFLIKTHHSLQKMQYLISHHLVKIPRFSCPNLDIFRLYPLF